MSLRYLTAGESHGPALVVILEGIPAGLCLTKNDIDIELKRRQKGFGAGERMKIEKDRVRILAGVMEKMTTGAPIAMMIENKDHAQWCGKTVSPFAIPRPGHADLVGVIKFGYNDLRPGMERASARETATRVVIGAVCKHFLAQFGIKIGGYVVGLGDIQAKLENLSFEERIKLAEQKDVRCPDEKAAKLMRQKIRAVIKEKETIGGIIEVIALNLPPGLGSFVHGDRRLDARLGLSLLSIQAIKGIEIGSAFDNTRLLGSQVQDWIYLRNGELVRKTNHSGGLEGGVTTGEPLIIRAAMKSIATTLVAQRSVNLIEGREVPTQYERSDSCPVPRAVPILEAAVAFVLADALMEKLGGDSMAEILPRFDQLRSTKLEDIHIDNKEHVYWEE